MNDLISPLLGSLTPYLSKLSALAVAAAFVWMIWRARSLFPMRYRLWRMSHPKGFISDERIKNAVKDRADLMTYRSLFGRADSIGDARRQTIFAEQLGLDPGALGECGPYFDRARLAVKASLPDLALTKIKVLGWTAVLMLLAAILLLWVAQSRILVRFNDDHTYFWLGADNASLFLRSNGVTLTTSNCSIQGNAAGFSPQHMAVLCKTFIEPGTVKYVDSEVRQQRIANFFLLAILLVIEGWWQRRLHAVRAGHILKRHIDDRDAPKNGAAVPELLEEDSNPVVVAMQDSRRA